MFLRNDKIEQILAGRTTFCIREVKRLVCFDAASYMLTFNAIIVLKCRDHVRESFRTRFGTAYEELNYLAGSRS